MKSRRILHKSAVAILALTMVLASGLLSMKSASAQTSVCGQWDLVGLVNNTYIYQQNEWNSSDRQCATAGPNAQFNLTTANFNLGGGSPATYPSLYKGCHPFGGETPNQGICSSNSNMPLRVSNVTGASTSVSGSGSSSIYNFAYDLWFTTDGSTEGRPRGGTELMIWLNYAGSIQPFGSQVGTATIGGTTWDVWTGTQDWQTISYRRQSRTNSASLDLLPFFRDAVSRGSLSNSSWLMDVEVGFEIWSGGQGLSVNSFSASISGSGVCTTCGATITPSPTVGPSPTPYPAGSGTGLQGEYYDNMDFSALKVTRTDPGVNFNWAGGSPDSSIEADTFSVRWTGQVQSRYSGIVTFYTSSDDGQRLWVNNQQIINDWTDHAATEKSGTIQLVGGQRCDLRLEYYENGGDASIVLSWSSPSQPKQVVPQSQLYPPAGAATATPTAGPTATPTRTPTRTPTTPAQATPTRTPTAPPVATPTQTPTPSGCLADGARCTSNSQCCSGVCGGSYWRRTCQPSTQPTPTPPPAATPTRTPTSPPQATSTRTPTSPPSGGACAVNYDIRNDWGSGMTVDVTITNNSSSAINGWTLTWTFPGNQQIVNLWGGSYSQSGSSISVTNSSWNPTIGANGGTAWFGFNGTYSGTNAVPTNFALNGTACQ